MKVTFEGDLKKVLKEMETMLSAVYTGSFAEAAKASTAEGASSAAPVDTPKAAKAQGPGPEAGPEVIPGVIPTGEKSKNPEISPMSEKPKKARTPKQLENDERLRAAALAKVAAGKKVAAKKETPSVVEEPAEEDPTTMDPADVVKLRQKTIEDLQAAYAGGHQKEVFELLARFGNGAKSFRELPADAFVPIRKAIDNGALT